MSMWKKAKTKVKSILTTPIPGPIVAGCLTGALLGTTTALFISLPVKSPRESTSVESTFGKNESLDVRIRLRSGEELQVRVTGASTMEVVQNLQRILKNLEKNHSIERYSPSIKLLEG